MKIYFYLLLILFGAPIEAFSQSTFIRHYGEFSGKGHSLIINQAGNYMIAGSKYKHLKHEQFSSYELNSFGDTLRLKLYGTDSLDVASQIIQTIDGGYALIGVSDGAGSHYERIHLVKTTSTGGLSWAKFVGSSNRERASSIQQLATGEFIIGGQKWDSVLHNYDFYLLKTDLNGDTIWTKTYGGSQNEELTSLKKTSDGGFILCGYSKSFTNGSKDCYLVKTNANGVLEWTNHFGGTLEDVANSVIESSDGGFVLTGYSQLSGNVYSNILAIKTNSSGDSVWGKTFEHGNRYSRGNDLIQASDYGYVMTGLIRTASSNGGFDLYILKIDQSGNMIDEKEFKIEPTNTAVTSSEGRSIIETSDGKYSIGGYWFSGSTFELLLVKTELKGLVGIEEENSSNDNYNLRPNPMQSLSLLEFTNPNGIEFQLSVYNSLGQQVRLLKNITTNIVEIDRGQLSSGVYYFQLYSSEKKIDGKFLIE